MYTFVWCILSYVVKPLRNLKDRACEINREIGLVILGTDDLFYVCTFLRDFRVCASFYH